MTQIKDFATEGQIVWEWINEFLKPFAFAKLSGTIMFHSDLISYSLKAMIHASDSVNTNKRSYNLTYKTERKDSNLSVLRRVLTFIAGPTHREK